MNTNEIKRHLFEGIENIDDSEFLMTIKELIDHKYSKTNPPKLSDWQLKRVRESENQIERGDFLTDKQVNALIDKWLEA
ncbi:MAG: hypothetical protein AAF934_03380 [Bacteroidota bacterium]